MGRADNPGVDVGAIVESKTRNCVSATFLFSVRSKERITVSHLEKILYPAAKFTKADVVNY